MTLTIIFKRIPLFRDWLGIEKKFPAKCPMCEKEFE
jgi:hypothetical protein